MAGLKLFIKIYYSIKPNENKDLKMRGGGKNAEKEKKMTLTLSITVKDSLYPISFVS